MPTAAASSTPASNGPPALPLKAKLSGRVSRILGRNPSPMTLTGTNIYLVGTGSSRILVDAGEAKPGVMEDILAVMEQEGCTKLEQIIVTHWHHDHIMGVPELLKHFGSLPVRKFMPPEGTAAGEGSGVAHQFGTKDALHKFLKDTNTSALADGEVIRCEGATLRVLFTPGHANDHVALMLEEEQALFTGDHILGWGTGTFEDLQLYMNSLRKMQSAQPSLLYPAHGPVVGTGKADAWIAMYITHRETRIEQVLKAVSSGKVGGLALEDVTRVVYADQPNVLSGPLFGAACHNTRLVLDALVKDSRCAEKSGFYFLQQARL